MIHLQTSEGKLGNICQRDTKCTFWSTSPAPLIDLRATNSPPAPFLWWWHNPIGDSNTWSAHTPTAWVACILRLLRLFPTSGQAQEHTPVISATSQTEAGRKQVPVQPGQLSCFKIEKFKKCQGCSSVCRLWVLSPVLDKKNISIFKRARDVAEG